jgi:hypothetical protein
VASIEKAELKIGIHKEAILGLEKQLENCKSAVTATQGAVQYIDLLSKTMTGYVEGLDKALNEGELNEDSYALVKSHCARMLNITLSTLRQAKENVTINKGKVLAVSDSIEVMNRMVKAEELKIENEIEKRRLEEDLETEVLFCPVCELVELVEDGDECPRCAKYRVRYGREPGPDLIKVEREGLQWLKDSKLRLAEPVESTSIRRSAVTPSHPTLCASCPTLVLLMGQRLFLKIRLKWW